jgi:hypothetical protein
MKINFNDTMVGTMLSFGAVMLVLIGMTGCSQNASTISPSDAQNVMYHLMYDRDPRSGLCYAVVASRQDFHWSQNGFTITYVPCTPEVEKLIRMHHQGD